MRNSFFLFFLAPLTILNQPFRLHEVRLRYIESGNESYYDVHTLFVAKKDAANFSFNSFRFDTTPAATQKISVIGKSVNDSLFRKGDTVLIQSTFPVTEKRKNPQLTLPYFLTKKPERIRYLTVDKFLILDDIIIRHNQ